MDIGIDTNVDTRAYTQTYRPMRTRARTVIFAYAIPGARTHLRTRIYVRTCDRTRTRSRSREPAVLVVPHRLSRTPYLATCASSSNQAPDMLVQHALLPIRIHFHVMAQAHACPRTGTCECTRTCECTCSCPPCSWVCYCYINDMLYYIMLCSYAWLRIWQCACTS